MFDEVEPVCVRDFALPLFDLGVDEFDHFPGVNADHVVVMALGLYFENGVPTIEIVALYQSRGLELRQDPINCRKPDVFACVDQGFVHLLCTEMALLTTFQYFQNTQSR